MHIEIHDDMPRNNEELAKALLAKAVLAIAKMLQPPGPEDDPNRVAMLVNRHKLQAAITSIEVALDSNPNSEVVADLVIHEAAMLMEKYMFDDADESDAPVRHDAPASFNPALN